MELQLQQYIDGMATLADIRNLDLVNPVVVLLEHPTLGTPYTTIASIVEPSYLGVPINTTWVVLDPNHKYYKKALKLKDPKDPTTSGIVNVISDGGLHLSWIEEQAYAEIFSDPQHYVLDIAQGPAGPKGNDGPAGPIGASGLQGPAPNVDYAYIIGQILNQINQGTTLSIVGPAQIIEGLTGSYSLQLNTTGGASVVTGQIAIQTPITGVSIDANNLVTVLGTALNADQNMTLNASVSHLGQTYNATKVVLLKNAIPVSLQASGLPATLNEGLNAQMTVIATYSNGTTANVTAQCLFTPTNLAALTVSATGLATAQQVSADAPVQVNITYVEAAIVLNAYMNTTVKNIVVTGLTISGPITVGAGSAPVQYSATASFSDGSSQDVTASAVFTLGIPAMGAFDTGGGTHGLFYPAQVVSNTTGNVDATYTNTGTTVNAVKSITVTAVAVPGVHPYYGVAPVTSVKNGAFILGLPGRGTNASQVGTFTLDSGAAGSVNTMFYAYPKAYGLTKFEDASTPGFYGGWDGALGDPTNPAKWGPLTVAVDTGGGVMVDYYLYETDYPGLGSVTWNAYVGP